MRLNDKLGRLELRLSWFILTSCGYPEFIIKMKDIQDKCNK